MDSHIELPKWASLSAHSFILKPRVTAMGRYLHSRIELRTLRVYRLINEELDFHTIKIRRVFWRSVPFLKDFGEPMSVGVKVILLVEGHTVGKHLHPYIESRTLRVHTCMYTMVLRTHQQRDGLSHYQNSTSLSAFGSILKDFLEPMSVGVKVILLVGHDKTLYIPM
jgi:hypothetical protein